MCNMPNSRKKYELTCKIKDIITIQNSFIMENEKIKALLDSFGARVPYPIYSELNKEFDISKKFSKYNIAGDRKSHIQKLKELSLVEDEDFNYIFQAIFDTYRENIEYGSKYVQYFQFSESFFESFYNFASSQTLDSDYLSKSYPYMVNSEELKKGKINEIHLVRKAENEDSLILVYTRIVDFFEKVSINPNEIKNLDLSGTFTEFYGVRKYLKQFIDVVYLNKKTHRVEIRIDYFKYTSDRQIQKQFSDFFGAFKAKMSTSLSRDFFDRKELNIHSTIKKINDDFSGRLVEICFSTKEGSNIKIKKRRADLDIRKEAYHDAGSKAVLNNLDIFRIGIVWENEKGIEIELLIPGSSSLVHTTQKEINEAIITNCKGIADFNFINNKITHFLSKNGSI